MGKIRVLFGPILQGIKQLEKDCGSQKPGGRPGSNKPCISLIHKDF